MAKKEVAVQGCTIEPTDPTISGAAPTITSMPNSKLRSEGKSAYVGGIDILITGQTRAGCVQNAPSTGTINPTATKNRMEGDDVMRVDDESDAITINGLQGQVACSFSYTAKITDAGQTKTKAE